MRFLIFFLIVLSVKRYSTDFLGGFTRFFWFCANTVNRTFSFSVRFSWRVRVRSGRFR